MDYVCYYRVSTRKQNLGIEAQREVCRTYAGLNGGRIIKEYQDKETGRDTGFHYANRPNLVEALNECKTTGAVLLVAKVDRLTRDLEDGAHLCKNYNIVFCDHPEMHDPIMQGLYFGLAMQERQYISERIKAALHVLKSNGVKLGSSKTVEELRKMGRRSSVVRREAARNYVGNKIAWSIASVMLENGKTLSDVARRLNKEGVKTIRNCKWSSLSVRNLSKIMCNT